MVTVTKPTPYWPSQKSVGNENLSNAKLWLTDSGKRRGMLSSYVATGKPTMAIQTAQVKLSKNKKMHCHEHG